MKRALLSALLHFLVALALWVRLAASAQAAQPVPPLQERLGYPAGHPMLRPALQLSDYVWRGLGIALQKRGEELAFFHTGANPGFKAVMFASLSAKRGVVSFANSNGGFTFNMLLVEHALGEQPAVFWLEEP